MKLLLDAYVWLCVSLATPQGTLLTGHTIDYSAEIQVHTDIQVQEGCRYYKITSECQVVKDTMAEKFVVSYLCEITNE